MELTEAQARRARMTSLLLAPGSGASRPPSTAGEVVEWFGAMQAQEVNSGLWSLGLRLGNATLTDLARAGEDRSTLRTWPMRGTVHLVPSRDAGWMVALMAPGPLRAFNRRLAALGLDEATCDRAVALWDEALAGDGRASRSECLAIAAAAGIAVEGQRGAHLLGYACQRRVLAIAPHQAGEQTFVRLEDWAPNPAEPEPDEALGTLALRYFRSHGPAPVSDLAVWTGLGLGLARRAISAAGDALTVVSVAGTPMHLAADRLDQLGSVRSGVVVPSLFDEFLFGYRDRSLFLPDGYWDDGRAGGDARPHPTIVEDGRVIAAWTRTVTPRRVTVTVTRLDGSTTPRRRAAVRTAFEGYAEHLERDLVLTGL